MAREHDLDGRFKQLGDQRRYPRTLTVSDKIWREFGRLAEQRGGGFSRSDLLEEWVLNALEEQREPKPRENLDVPVLPPREQVEAKIEEIILANKTAKKGTKFCLEKLVEYLYSDHALIR